MSAKARQKTGPGVGQCAEGFFCLDFLLLFYQEKSSSPRGNERNKTSRLNGNISAEERSIYTM